MQRNYEICHLMVQTSVPLHILRIQARGGVTDDDFARVTANNEDFAGEQSVYLLIRSPKVGVTAQIFNHLCDAIAVLAFIPGGITIFGDHYVVEPAADANAEDETVTSRST